MGRVMEGVNLFSLKRISAAKGDIYHALKSTDEGYTGFGEVYFSEIICGEAKGWKRHNRMTLNLVVPVGNIKFVVYDDRCGSPSYGQFEEIILSPSENYQRLNLAPGLWLAFFGMSPGVSILMDVIPEPHDPLEADRKDLFEIPYNFDV